MDTTTRQALADLYTALSTTEFQLAELYIMAVAVKNALDENPDFEAVYRKHYEDAKRSVGAKGQFDRSARLQRIAGELNVL